jgi:hypothetical protein
MIDRPEADIELPTATIGAPSVLDVAEDREHFAPQEATREIASWVNEGGAGGEVRR